MNSSINYSGFTDMLTKPSEECEPYECNETNASLEKVYNSIQTYKAGFSDREYQFDE